MCKCCATDYLCFDDEALPLEADLEINKMLDTVSAMMSMHRYRKGWHLKCMQPLKILIISNEFLIKLDFSPSEIGLTRFGVDHCFDINSRR